MPMYLALTFTADVDWSDPQYADEMKDWTEFGEAAAAVIRGGNALYPTATATTVRANGQGRRRHRHRRPLRRDEGGADRLLPAGMRRPGRGRRRRREDPRCVDRGGRGAARPPVRLTGVLGAGDAVARLVREEGTRVLATLVRVTGSVDVAEDAAQDAVVRALETWPRDGVPDNPRAWLLVTAKRRAIDLIRREARRPGKEAAADSDDCPIPNLLTWSATTCCGSCSPAATRRWGSTPRWLWRCALWVGCPPLRWLGG